MVLSTLNTTIIQTEDQVKTCHKQTLISLCWSFLTKKIKLTTKYQKGKLYHVCLPIKCCNCICCRRRVVLTGFPLQNNLMNYWCMVDFGCPNYLGTKTEFSNMFERPVTNGQCLDSTPTDVKLMRYRAYVVYSLLEGCVQRSELIVIIVRIYIRNKQQC